MTTKYRVINFEFNRIKFGQELTYHVNFRKLTIESIAQVAGISETTVKHLMVGDEPSPKMSTFLGICNALDLDPRDYFALEE